MVAEAAIQDRLWPPRLQPLGGLADIQGARRPAPAAARRALALDSALRATPHVRNVADPLRLTKATETDRSHKSPNGVARYPIAASTPGGRCATRREMTVSRPTLANDHA
jgi:hypothetical protein